MNNNKATCFLTKVSINEVFHLKDFEIGIDEKELKHLILTGKNGSGKTILMNSMLAYLNKYRDNLHNTYLEPKSGENTQSYFIGNGYPVKLYFNESYRNIIQSEDFILAHYEANRKPSLIEPTVPSKPDLQRNQKIEDKKVDQFLNFLIDLKTQEVYARNEGALQGADEIKAWFVDFEDLLKTLFDNPKLKLEFQYQDYSFWINDHNKRFKFTQLSDGYSAIMDIIADLILKMQDTDRLHRTYFKHGIVLIDELETHLHLQLQGKILPMLTKIFPNIQFIVTTHSSFVLNSLANAVVYDLE